MILLASLIAAGLYLANRSTFSSNKGHRVQRNRTSVVTVYYKKPRTRGHEQQIVDHVLDEAPEVIRSRRGKSSFSVVLSTKNVSEFMSNLRDRFRGQIADGEVSIRVDRNQRGRDVERGNRGRQR